jgi:hypothetical protein
VRVSERLQDLCDLQRGFGRNTCTSARCSTVNSGGALRARVSAREIERLGDEADDEEALVGAPCAPPSTRRRSHPAFAHLSSFALTLRPLRLCGEVQRSVLVRVARCTSPQRRKGRKVKAKEDSNGSNGALRGFCG